MKPRCFGNYGNFNYTGKAVKNCSSCTYDNECLDKRNRVKSGIMCKLTSKVAPPPPPAQPK